MRAVQDLVAGQLATTSSRGAGGATRQPPPGDRHDSGDALPALRRFEPVGIIPIISNNFRRRLYAVAAALLVVLNGCGGGASSGPTPAPSVPVQSGPPEPTATVTPSSTLTFVADLRASNEVPPVSDAEAKCHGRGTLVLDARIDASGAIYGATAQWEVLVNDCPETTKITLAHIHKAGAGANGDVAVDFGLTATDPVDVNPGGDALVHEDDKQLSDFRVVADLLANPASYYFDVHSAVHPNGLMRGQFVKQAN